MAAGCHRISQVASPPGGETEGWAAGWGHHMEHGEVSNGFYNFLNVSHDL